ncbi:MAG: hypothetical protein RRC34_08595 [Lentisphaeria bacterium]|nr:hypothetical protein [Lentisphaeria bacterium]
MVKRADTPPSELTFQFVFPDDHNPEYATGCWGGVCPNTDISMHFYVERAALPKKVTHTVEGGKLGSEVRRDPQNPPLIRFVTTGVVMNQAAAEGFHRWLGQKLEEAKKLRQTATGGK